MLRISQLIVFIAIAIFSDGQTTTETTPFSNVTFTNSTSVGTTKPPKPPPPKPPLPRELKFSRRIATSKEYCPFGTPVSPIKYCEHQRHCHSDFNWNSYCSQKSICCQEESEEVESLCYDRRLPLFGENECNVDADCENQRALCKSGHCCPNYHHIPNEPLQPPTHFYSSNFPCIPGHPIPPGFNFAFCSNFSSTIAYVGVVNKCGLIQHISKDTECKRDSDCFHGHVCVFVIDGGVCFKNPEVCMTSALYDIVWYNCLIAFIGMLLSFLTRAFYLYPVETSNYIPYIAIQNYDCTDFAKDQAVWIYSRPWMTKTHIYEIRRKAERKALRLEKRMMKWTAVDYILYYFGLVVDDGGKAEEKDEQEELEEAQ
ncbi:unnamed protein product [Caenorhabditis sp. 36 PRJEB53466]|nr:unnamed protein product [Caenorhabditis sp. 36 PRJEB53466]